jgi:hypothetical protein
MRPDPSTAAFAMNMAMHANLAALAYQLDDASKLVTSARNDMESHDHNLAVGTVLPLERILPECDGLFRTFLLLHRGRASFEQNEVHS